VTLVALLGFLAYMLAEGAGLSGIFSVFFAGLTMSHYTWHALSPSAKVVTGVSGNADVC
jgi:NhaP-type Na+/H+ or K+/H+ antiporter